MLLAIDVLARRRHRGLDAFQPAGPDRTGTRAPGWSGEGFEGDEYVGFESEWVTGPDGVRQRRYATDYQAPLNEYEAFSADQAWMPNVVLMAKSTYVWLEQLSKKYGRHIHRLDQIPDEELRSAADARHHRPVADRLVGAQRGFADHQAAARPADAVASAYSLKDYAHCRRPGRRRGL